MASYHKTGVLSNGLIKARSELELLITSGKGAKGIERQLGMKPEGGV